MRGSGLPTKDSEKVPHICLQCSASKELDCGSRNFTLQTCNDGSYLKFLVRQVTPPHFSTHFDEAAVVEKITIGL